MGGDWNRRIDYDFKARNLTPNGGFLPFVRFLKSVGFDRAVKAHPEVKRSRRRHVHTSYRQKAARSLGDLGGGRRRGVGSHQARRGPRRGAPGRSLPPGHLPRRRGWSGVKG